MKFWETFNITLRVETEFELGDGRFFSQVTKSFIWFDINPSISLTGTNFPAVSQNNFW